MIQFYYEMIYILLLIRMVYFQCEEYKNSQYYVFFSFTNILIHFLGKSLSNSSQWNNLDSQYNISVITFKVKGQSFYANCYNGKTVYSDIIFLQAICKWYKLLHFWGTSSLWKSLTERAHLYVTKWTPTQNANETTSLCAQLQ